MATNVQLQVVGSLFGTELEVDIQVAGGPLSIRVAPKEPLDFLQLWRFISQQMESLAGFGLPDLTSGPWGKLLESISKIEPTLWIGPATSAAAASANPPVYLELAFVEPVKVGGEWQVGDITITLSPSFLVWSLYIGYDSKTGFGLRAKISNLSSGGDQSSLPSPANAKIVTYPFPVPAQNSVGVFQLHYLGIGQRVGPNVNVTADDPMTAIFEVLETQLVGDDPVTILTKVAKSFYHPDRNWFIAADLELRGFRVRILFNDPSIYGLQISVADVPLTPFSGLLFEILYQKLSPNLGVYYGALTLPTAMRRIPLNGWILILPGFSIWVYTNGDFRVNVGWPIGPASIGVQVSVLVGLAGFYFAKLRSGDNPGVPATVDYNPILAFGIGVGLSVQQGFNASIFSASISVNLTATFQGLLAWESGNSISGPPDHYWFAGTASIAVLIQGTVDFSIIKASVLIQFTANAGIAFETGCRSLITVAAAVRVEVRVKIVFFTISLSFKTQISQTWEIGSGSQVASLNGPVGMTVPGPAVLVDLRQRALRASRQMIDRFSVAAVLSPEARLDAASRAAAVAPELIELQFLLQPTAVYTDTGGAFNVIASLLIDAPAGPVSPGSPARRTPFERLLVALVKWLLAMFPSGTLSERFAQIVQALGAGSQAPFGNWNAFAAQLMTFLQSGCTFQIVEVDTASPSPERSVAVLPMLPVLRMIYIGPDGKEHTVDFDSFTPVPAIYPTAVNLYFQEIGFDGNAPLADDRSIAALASPSTDPSMASYVWVDYFAMELRNAANALWQAAQKYEDDATAEFLSRIEEAHWNGQPWDFVDHVGEFSARIIGQGGQGGQGELDDLLDSFDYASAAGLGSRFLLAGLQLPVPSLVPSDPTPANMAKVPTAGLYVLTGQQFAVAQGAAAATATLMINPDSGAPPGWVIFESGSPGSVTCQFHLPPQLPPSPQPEWQEGSPASGGPGTVVVTPLPPVSWQPLYVTLKNQIAWSDNGQPQTIFPLPSDILSAARGPAGAGIRITTEPPPDTNSAPRAKAAPLLPATPGLLIRLSLTQVPSGTLGALTGPGSPAGVGSPPGAVPTQFLPFVYQLNGTDEATRDLLFQALKSDLSAAKVRLLYSSVSGSSSPGGPGGLQSDDIATDVLVAKTNLSTLNQAPAVGPLFALMMRSLEDVTFAPVTDAAGFLELVWQVSVVNAPGFFLFYLTTDLQGLPGALFSDTGTEGGLAGQFNILVELAEQPAATVPIGTFTNCVFLPGAIPSTETLYAAVEDSSGAPVRQYSPTYPAGNVGQLLTWQSPQPSPGDPVPVGELYHLIQYQVQDNGGYSQSVWSLPAGPTEDNAPAHLLPESAEALWQYLQTIPVYLFAPGASPSGSRYTAIGLPVDIALRVLDIYGDPLPGTYTTSQTPLYQDPLVGLGEWPGVHIYFLVTAGPSQSAQLVLEAAFDPSFVVPPSGSPGSEASVQQQWLSILQRYTAIVEQLADPHVKLTVTTTLTNGEIQESAAIGARLLQFAREIRDEVAAAAASSPSPQPSPVAVLMTGTLPFAQIMALPADIFPVTVTVTLARDPDLVAPEALRNLPAAAAVSYSIPPSFSAGGSPGAAGSPLTGFAIEFENAFFGFDGASPPGQLKVAQRAGVTSGDDPSQVRTLWAVRWSRASGISVELSDDLVFFGLQPLSTTPLSYSDSVIAVANADLDRLANQFLLDFDAFLNPKMAVAVAILDVRGSTTYYDEITGIKEELARTIPLGLTNILASQAGSGDLEDAQARLEQALLSALGNAFAVTTVVQVPSEVTVVGLAEASPGLQPPSLFGTIGPPQTGSPGPGGSPGSGQKPYSFSNGELEVATGAPWITTLLTVTQPGEQAALFLPLLYDVSYLQHDFRDADPAGAGSYIASSWLKFVRPGMGPLQMPVTSEAAIPVPLIFEPPAPSLISQAASASALGSPASPGSIEQEIEAALHWDYQLRIIPSWSSQDEIFFEVLYNSGLSLAPKAFAANGDPKIQLLQALSIFLAWYDETSPHFGNILAEAYPATGHASALTASPFDPAEMIDTFRRLARNVADAWAELYKPRLAKAFAAFDHITDSFHFVRDSKSPSTLLVYGRSGDGSNPLYWPAITTDGETWVPDRGQAQPVASPEDGWLLSHTFRSDSFEQLSLDFTGIDMQQRQTATASAWLRRNAALIPGEPTNPAFIYETQVVRFPTYVVPLIHRGSLDTVEPDEGGLAATLIQILTPIANPAAQWNSRVRLSAGYSWALTAPPKGLALQAAEAILLADNLRLQGSPSALVELANQLAAELASWHGQASPSAAGALLNLSITVFSTVGDGELPLIQIDRIPIDVSEVPPAWWGQMSS